MTILAQIADIEGVEHPHAAELLLHPLRQRILHEASEPASAAEIARRVDLPAQKVNYHVRALVDAGLLVPAGERLKRNLVEKRYRATARAYVLLPKVLGEISPEWLSLSDEVSAAHLIQLASTLQSELSSAIREVRNRAGEVPTLSLDVELRFDSAAQRAAFATALQEVLTDVVGRFSDPAVDCDGAPSPGRPYRLVVGCYPIGPIGDGGPGEPRSQDEADSRWQ